MNERYKRDGSGDAGSSNNIENNRSQWLLSDVIPGVNGSGKSLKNTVSINRNSFSEDRMNRFDSALSTRTRAGGSPGHLSTLFAALVSLFVLGSVALTAQPTLTHTGPTPPAGPFVLGEICDGEAPEFDITTDALPTVVYNAADFAWPGLVAHVAPNAIPIGVGPGFIGDDQVYQIPAADIAAQAAGGAFEFDFYGETHDLADQGLFVGTNGFVRFQDGDLLNDAAVELFETGIAAQNLPAAGGPNGAIYFLNIDLAPQVGDLVEWELMDVNGDEALVLTFTGVSQYNPVLAYPYNEVTVQLILFPNNHGANPNEFQVRLEDWPDPAVVPVRDHTIGVENKCGNAATTPGAPGVHNQDDWVAGGGAGAGNGTNQTAWEFVPANGADQAYQYRLVAVGPNLNPETYSRTILGGDDLWRSANLAGVSGVLEPVTSNTTVSVTTPAGELSYYAVIEYDNCGIVHTDVETITVNPTPTQTTITGDNNVCVGDVEDYSVPLTAGNTYEWTTSDGAATVLPLGPTVDGNVATITWATGSNGGTATTLTCVETTPTGCETTHTVFNLNVFTVPVGAITGPTTACALTSENYSFPGGFGAYQWTVSGGPAGTAAVGATNTPALTVSFGDLQQPSAPSVATIAIEVTNGGECVFNTSINVTVNPRPNAKTISANDDTPCVDQTINYTITTVAGNTYAWTAGGGSFAWTAPGGYVNGTPVAGLGNVSLQWTDAGTGRSITVEEVTANGCSRTHELLNIEVEALPTPIITGPSVNVCGTVPQSGVNPAFSTTPAVIDHDYAVGFAVPGNEYSWTITGGTITSVNGAGVIGGGGTTASGIDATQITVQWNNPAGPNPGPGVFQTVDLVETSQPNGCVGNATTFNVQTVHTPTPVDFNLAGPGIAGAPNPCANDLSVLYVGSTSPAIPVASHQFYVLAGGAIDLTIGNQVFVNWGNAAQGILRHEVTTFISGCSSYEDYTIDIQPLPDGDIDGPSVVCGGAVEAYSIINQVNNPFVSTTWSIPTNPGAIATLVTPAVNPTATLSFGNPGAPVNVVLQADLVGPGPSNCTNTITYNITVNPTPPAPVHTGPNGANPNWVCAGQTYNYTVSGVVGGTTTIIVTNGTPSQTVFVGPGPHNYTITWGLVPVGGAGQISASSKFGDCVGPNSLYNVTISSLPAAPIFEYSLDGIVYQDDVPPLCVTDVPFWIRVKNVQPNVDYNWHDHEPFTSTVLGPQDQILRVNNWNGSTGNQQIWASGVNVITGCENLPDGTHAPFILTGWTRVANPLTVNPVPTPDLTLNIDEACNNVYDPAGINGSVIDADPLAFTYDFSTDYVAVNSYSWTVTNGYIVGYRVNGGAWTYIDPVQTTTGAPVLGANEIRVAFYGLTPGAVKVSEIAPGGCQTTTPDWLVTLNTLPMAQDLNPDQQDICSLDDALLTQTTSENGFTYRAEVSADGGTTWTTSSAATQAGTGLDLNWTIPAADLVYTATPPAVTNYKVRITAQNMVGGLTCGWYPTTDVVDVDVNPKPAADIPVEVVTNEVCFGADVEVNVGDNVTPSEAWVEYRLERRQIRDLNDGLVGVPTGWSYVGSPVVGNGVNNITLIDDTDPAGGVPLIANDNYEYRVEATSFMGFAPPPNIQCTTLLTEQDDARVFALPTDPTVTFTPNPVCWEEDVTVNMTNTQEGVQYEVNIGGTSLAPPVIIDGNGGNASAVVNSVYFQPTNPIGLGSVFVNDVQVRAYLSEYGAFIRPIPTDGCPVEYGTVDLEVLEKPVAEITGPDTVCGPSTVDYTATPVTPAPVATYDWQFINNPDAPPAGTTPLVANNTGDGTVNPLTVDFGINLLSCDGSYNPLNTQLRLIATNDNGCEDTAFIDITVNPTVSDAEVVGDTTACIYGGYEDHLKTYTVERPGLCVFPDGTEYLWTMPSGTVSGAIRSGQFTPTIIAEWHTTGGTNIGTVTCQVTLPDSVGGCITTRTLDVVVYPLPQPVITGPQEVCQNQQGVVYTADNYPTDTYTWEVLGGTVVGGTGTGVPGDLGTITGVGTNIITVNWLDEANPNAYIKLTQISIADCMNETIYDVTVHPTPVPSIDGPETVCDNAVVSYSTANNAPNNVYNWSISGNGTIQSGSNQATVTVLTGAVLSGSSFTLTLTETVQATTCETTVQRTINIVETPNPTITRISPAGGFVGGACLGQVVEYGDTDPVAANPTYSYFWTVSNGAIDPGTPANGSTIKVEWNTVGTGTVTLAKWHAGTQCTTTVSQDVNITEIPEPAIAGPIVVCGDDIANYSTPAVVGNNYAWTIVGDGAITGGANANAAIVEFSNPATAAGGSATLTVVETNTLSGCEGTASVVITVGYMPQATEIAGLETVCNGSTETYSITNEPVGLDYLWTVTGGTIATDNGNSIDVMWTAEGNQTVGVTISTPGSNCETTITKNVTVEFQPAPAITGDAIVCTEEVEVYSTPANAGSTYMWTVTGGTITSGAASHEITVEWTDAGAQTVSVTETNASGNCFASTTLNVMVSETPATTMITRTDGGNVNHACEGETYTYGTDTPNANTYEYMWTVTGGEFVAADNTPTVDVKWTLVGAQTISVVVTTPGSDCDVEIVQNVAVTPKPQPNIDGALVACINKDHVYQTPFVAGNTYEWLITPANVFAPITGYPNSNVIEVKWIQPGLHTVEVTETNVAGGCATTVSIDVQVNLIPEPFITSTTGYGNPPGRRPGIVCNFSTHTYTTFETPMNTFIWTVEGGTIVTGQYTNTIDVLWGPSGIGTIAVEETIPGSDCITTILDSIDIRPTPTPVITGEFDPCGNSVQQYATPFVSGNSWAWTVVGGTILNGQGTSNITVRWNEDVWPNTIAGNVKVVEWVTDVLPSMSCIDSTNVNITVRPNPPVPTITGPAVVCATDLNTTPATDNMVTYTTSVPAQGGAQGFISYAWATSANGQIIGSSTSTAVNVRWTNAGNSPVNGTVTVVHTSSFGCTSQSTLNVTINPIPTPEISGPTSVCQNAIHTYSTPGLPGHVYNWTVVGGNIIRSGQGTPNVTVEWSLPGTYDLSVNETNTYGCDVTNTISVTVNELPDATIMASGPTTFCQGGDVTLTAPIGFASYVWSTGETARSIVVRTTGTYWVKVTDDNGCSNNSDTITVNVFPNSLPVISVSGPTTFCEGGEVTLTAPAGFDAYLWSTGETTQSITVSETGSYSVIVADDNGCTGTSTEVDVFVNPKPTPILTVVGSTTVCSGDSVEVRAPAGFVSYMWTSTSGTDYGTERSAWVLATDTLYCTVVDANGCVGESDTVAIMVAPVVAPVIAPDGPTIFCEGGSVTLSAPEGFATYYWSNGATSREINVSDAGSYFVTVTNGAACESISDPTDISVNPLPARPDITRTGDTLKAVTVVAETYQWYHNGVMVPGASQRFLVVTKPGTYRVEIADNNTCSSISDGFDVILTSVDEDIVAGHTPELNIFPNPTNGQFTIETEIHDAGTVRIELINTVGEVVMSLNEVSNGGMFTQSIDMGTLASGVYHVVVSTNNQRWNVQVVRQ